MKLLLDAGHGGVAWGQYLTAGKRSPQVPPGIYEGEFNRQICWQLFLALRGAGVDCLILNPGLINISLSERIKYINRLNVLVPDLHVLSIHANASGNDWDEANGAVVFVSGNCSDESLALATILHNSVNKFSDIKMRYAEVLSRDFSILSVTNCPAVLLECGFMTNKNDTEILNSASGQSRIVYAIWDAIMTYKQGAEK